MMSWPKPANVSTRKLIVYFSNKVEPGSNNIAVEMLASERD